MPTRFMLNGRRVTSNAPNATPLLWVIREEMRLTGTKFGCGAGLCGACMVHINGARAYSCQTELSSVAGKRITTIEGISARSNHPVQRAWLAENVPQCGYCQSGQIMSAVDLLNRNKNPSREQIVEHMSTNICRCGTYQRIVKAIQRAARSGDQPQRRASNDPAARSGDQPQRRASNDPAARSGDQPQRRASNDPAARSGAEPQQRRPAKET